MKIYKKLISFVFLVFNLSILSTEVNKESLFVGLDFPPEYQIGNIQTFLKRIKSFKAVTPFVKIVQVTGNINNPAIAQKIKEAIEKFNLAKKSIKNLKIEKGAELIDNQIIMKLASEETLTNLNLLSGLVSKLLNNAQINVSAIQLKPYLISLGFAAPTDQEKTTILSKVGSPKNTSGTYEFAPSSISLYAYSPQQGYKLMSTYSIQVDQKELYKEADALIVNMNQYYEKFNNIISALSQGKIDDKTFIKDAGATQIKAKIGELYQLLTNNFLDRKKIEILIPIISDQKTTQALQQSVGSIKSKWVTLTKLEDVPLIESIFINMEELGEEYSKLTKNFGEELKKNPESFDFEAESKKFHNAVDFLIAKIKIKPLRSSLEKYLKEFPNLIKDPNEKSSQHDFTALHVASTNGDLDAAQELIQMGANVNARGIHNITPLMQAAYYDHADVVKLLLENRADTTVKTSNTNQTVLDIARARNSQKTVKLLEK